MLAGRGKIYKGPSSIFTEQAMKSEFGAESNKSITGTYPNSYHLRILYVNTHKYVYGFITLFSCNTMLYTSFYVNIYRSASTLFIYVLILYFI